MAARSLPIPEDPGSRRVISNLYCIIIMYEQSFDNNHLTTIILEWEWLQNDVREVDRTKERPPIPHNSFDVWCRFATSTLMPLWYGKNFMRYRKMVWCSFIHLFLFCNKLYLLAIQCYITSLLWLARTSHVTFIIYSEYCIS